IEHIPSPEHPRLFENIGRVTRPGSRLVLTYPSPQYQSYLRENIPSELQIIDEIVEIPTIVKIAAAYGFALKHYSLEDVWMENQYVHTVFQRDLKLQPLASSPEYLLRRIKSK